MTILPSFRPLPTTVMSACMLAIVLGVAGCYGDRTAYPDPTNDTKIRADEIRADGVRRTTAVDTDLAQREREYDFRIAQVKDRYTHDRGVGDLERDKHIEPLNAKANDAKATSDREIADIDAALATKVKQADGAEEIRLKAEAASARAASVQKQSEATAKFTAERDLEGATARQNRTTIDTREAKEVADIQTERGVTERKAQADRLTIDADTNKRLDGLGKDSKSRMDQASETAADKLDADRSTDKAIRKTLDSDRTRTGDVAFTSNRGAVSLTGTVANDEIHRDIVSRISKLNGVMSVEDLITIH